MKPLDPEAIALLKAADYIAEHGWCQEQMIDSAGRVCAVGAITMVTGGENAPLGARLDAECRLREYLGEFVPPWNDDPDRTEEQVIASLRAAALTTAKATGEASDMRFWFDTEFYEDGHTIELISIGVASEDGREYYAEVPDALKLANKTRWLSANVAPHLTQNMIRDHGSLRHTYQSWQIAGSLIDFMGEKPEIWAYYADYDWVALCQLFGTMMDLPKGWPMYCRDLKQWCDALGNPKLPEQGKSEHHALADAVWARDAWRHLANLALTAGKAQNG